MNNQSLVLNAGETDAEGTPALTHPASPARTFPPEVAQRVLTYHEILPSLSRYIYRLTNSQFQEHLQFLASASGVFSRDAPSTSTLITFDDGHRSNYEQAFPLLERFRKKAIFFVLGGLVGREERHISWEHAREMHSAGHRIESHGWSHRLLTQCNQTDLESELKKSKEEIEDQLGDEVSSISAPGGRWDMRVAEAAAQAGYKYLFHSNPWVPVTRWRGIALYGRHMVTGQMGTKDLQALMNMSGTRRLYSRCGYAAKEQVRKLMGDQLYHRVWCWLSNWKPEDGMEIEVGGPHDHHSGPGH